MIEQISKDVKKTMVEIESYLIEIVPMSVYFIKSGFPNKHIMITEDPFDGPECELITEEEKQMFIELYHTDREQKK